MKPADQDSHSFICLFNLFLYVPVNNFSVMSRQVFLGWTSTKQGKLCLSQGHTTVMLVRLEPATPRSPGKHSTTGSLRSLCLFWCFYVHLWPCWDGQLNSDHSKKQNTLSMLVNSFLASGSFCRLLITFANSLDPDQDGHSVGPDLDPSWVFLNDFFEEVYFEEKVSRQQQKHAILPSM